MRALHYLRIHNMPILQQLQLEEALLRTDSRNWCLVNDGAPPAVVLGISNPPEAHLDRTRSLNIPLVRRFSGGGSVVVDENTLFVSFICNTQEMGISPFPKQVLHWSAAHFEKSLQPHPFRVHENDFAMDNRKFGGNAQYLTRTRFVHHSTLLWDYSEERMSLLSLPPKQPAYRQARAHRDFLCRLKDYLPGKQAFEYALQNTLSLSFHLQQTAWDEAAYALKQPHRSTSLEIQL